MKRIILALTMVLSILFQPCLAAGKQEKIDLSTYKKPDVELKHYDVCLYTLAPDELRFNMHFYPLPDGETRKVPADTLIEVHVSRDNIEPNVSRANVKIYNDEFDFYERTFTPNDEGQIYFADLNSDMFAGNVTLTLELMYKDGGSETYNFYFEKEDSYSDIKYTGEPFTGTPEIVSYGTEGAKLTLKIENFSKLLYPEKISVKSSSGKDCISTDERKIKENNSRINIPIEFDGFDRDYRLTIPAGTILLKDGLNNELVCDVRNEIKYVTLENFMASASPAAEQIKYITGEEEEITVTIVINKDFKVDDTKPLYFNRREVDYDAEITGNGTVLTFSQKAQAGTRCSVEFGEGMIIGQNGEKSGLKEYYNFSVVDIGTLNLPDKAIFTDVPTSIWAFDYISQLAMADIISGYEDKTFKPNGAVTRGELAKMLAAAFDLAGSSSYSDVKDHWAVGYIARAGRFIPTKGRLFEPDNKATRQDVAVALVNILTDEKGMKLEEAELNFVDLPMIDEEYLPQIGKAVAAGIVSGYSDGNLFPEEPVSRAETAAMICRLINQQEK